MELIDNAPYYTDVEFGLIALKIYILIAQKKYQEALRQCDILQTGFRLGKPSIKYVMYRQDYLNHVMRSKIYALTNRPQDAVREAYLAWYMAIRVGGYEQTQAIEQLQALKLQEPKELVPITTDNDAAFRLMDSLMQFDHVPTKEEAEKIFKRPLFQGERGWGSIDGRDVFWTIGSVDYMDLHAVSVKPSVDRIYLTRTDFEKHFGKGELSEWTSGSTHGGFSRSVAETFKRGNASICVVGSRPILEFTVTWSPAQADTK
jgi:hypothetical protein